MSGNTNPKGVPPSRNGPVRLNGAFATSIKTDAVLTTFCPTTATPRRLHGYSEDFEDSSDF